MIDRRFRVSMIHMGLTATRADIGEIVNARDLHEALLRLVAFRQIADLERCVLNGVKQDLQAVVENACAAEAAFALAESE